MCTTEWSLLSPSISTTTSTSMSTTTAISHCRLHILLSPSSLPSVPMPNISSMPSSPLLRSNPHRGAERGKEAGMGVSTIHLESSNLDRPISSHHIDAWSRRHWDGHRRRRCSGHTASKKTVCDDGCRHGCVVVLCDKLRHPEKSNFGVHLWMHKAWIK